MLGVRNIPICLRCAKMASSLVYSSILICFENGNVIPALKETCPNYLERSFSSLVKRLSEHGFLYCADCKKPIYSIDELQEHVNDLILTNYPPDEVVHEESPVAD